MKFFILKGEKEIIRVAENELAHIQIEGHMLTWTLSTGEKYYSTASLKKTEEKLSQAFIRISRWCLISKHLVRKFDRYSRILYLQDGSTHQVSKKMVDDILDLFEE